MSSLDIQWLFFDLGNTLVSEEESIRVTAEKFAQSCSERGIALSGKQVLTALEDASTAFADRPIVKVIESLVDSPEERADLLDQLDYQMSSAGSFWWDGFFGTHFWVDPSEELVLVLMKQHFPFDTALMNRFRTLVYQAIED